MSTPDARSPAARSQTLHRGLVVLEAVAGARTPQTVAELADRTGLHRSIVYRLVRTLEDHHLLARAGGDAYRLGYGLASLARGLTGDIHGRAAPVLQRLADTWSMSCFVTAREGDDAVSIVVATPTNAGPMFVEQVGSRHDVHRGAPGHALRMLDPDGTGDARLAEFAARGWAFSRDEVIDGVCAVAAPLAGETVPMALAVSWVGHAEVDALAADVLAACADVVAGRTPAAGPRGGRRPAP